jgi:hypothetical protein
MCIENRAIFFNTKDWKKFRDDVFRFIVDPSGQSEQGLTTRAGYASLDFVAVGIIGLVEGVALIKDATKADGLVQKTNIDYLRN